MDAAMEALRRGDVYGWASSIDADQRIIVPMPAGVEVPMEDHHRRDPNVLAIVARTGATLVTIAPDGECLLRSHVHEQEARECYEGLVTSLQHGMRVMSMMIDMRRRLENGENPDSPEVIIVPDDLSTLHTFGE